MTGVQPVDWSTSEKRVDRLIVLFLPTPPSTTETHTHTDRDAHTDTDTHRDRAHAEPMNPHRAHEPTLSP